MEEIINKLLGIDSKARSIITEYENKRANLDYYISEEIIKRKQEIDLKFKFRIDFEKNKYEKRLQEKKSIMQEIKTRGINELNAKYYIEKNRLANEIFNSIIQEGE